MEAGVGALLGLGILFILFVIAIGIVLYLLNAFGFYGMAKKIGSTHAWFAFIPYLQQYLEGEIIDDKVAFGKNIIPYASIILGAGAIIVSFVSSAVEGGFLGAVIGIIGILYAIYTFAALYRLYRLYKPDSATLYLVLSIIFAFLTPIFIFTLRNETQVEYLSDQEVV